MTKILVIDDDEINRLLFSGQLKKQIPNCTVISAQSGEEGIEKAKAELPDAILLDVMMRGLNGFEVCECLKAHKDTRHIPIIMMTAMKTDTTSRIKALELGADAFLNKPFDMAELAAQINVMLRIKKAEDALREERDSLEKLVEERAKGLIESEAKLEERNRELKRVNENLKETQAQIIQQEKMASIGQLAAGVAHEINNPMGFISSNLITLEDYHKDVRWIISEYRSLASDLETAIATGEGRAGILERLKGLKDAERDMDLDFILDDIAQLREESTEGAERIKRIVMDLKDFAHPSEDQLQTADINKNLDSTLNIVRNELKYKATVTKEYGDLPQLRCYPQQLNQVFMNLLVNAAHAIEKQGNIKISTRAVNEYVEIAVSDTGTGIPTENVKRVFDPFFTTKEIGSGTGLGLNVSYNIIKKHKGAINVESEVGKGTTFTIRIPVE